MKPEHVFWALILLAVSSSVVGLLLLMLPGMADVASVFAVLSAGASIGAAVMAPVIRRYRNPARSRK